MKKLILLFGLLLLFSCSSSEDSNNNSSSGQLTFNETDYDFDHIYIRKRDDADYPYFQIFLTKGTMTISGDSDITYSDNFVRMVGMVIYSGAESLSSGTRQFPLFTQTVGENFILFRDSFSIESGNALTFDTIFTPNDNITEQSRVVINKISDTKYSFDFNVITSAGTFTGYYVGDATIIAG